MDAESTGIPRIRVLVCSPDPYVRLGLRAVVTSDTSLALIGEARDTTQIESLTSALRPDVIVLEADASRLDELGGFESILIVMVDSTETAVEWMTYTHANIGGLVHREAPPDQVVEAIRRASDGQGYISPNLGGALLRVVRSRLPPSRATVKSYSPLTLREKDVFDLVRRGLSNKEIAQRLHISEKTVKFHVSNLLAKCQLTTRSLLIASSRPGGALAVPGALPAEGSEA